MAVEINFSKGALLEAIQEKLWIEGDLCKNGLVLGPPESNNDVGALDRDHVVRWLWRTHEELGLHADTFVLAVSLVDRFLNVVKVHMKYFRCAALSCYMIAAKMLEEPEKVPSALQVIKTTHSKFGPSDINKMERIVLQKLEWNISAPTPYDFLSLFVALLWQNDSDGIVQSLNASNLLHRVALQLQECLCSSVFLKFKGSFLVLALISCALESSSAAWFRSISWVLKLTGISTKELLAVRQEFASITSRSVKSRPLPLALRNLPKQPGPLSPIRENPFEVEFAAVQPQRGGACAFPTSPSRALSPTKRLVRDGFMEDRRPMSDDDVSMDVSSGACPSPVMKKVRRAPLLGCRMK